MNTEQELKKHHQAIKALEMIQYHEGQLLELNFDIVMNQGEIGFDFRNCKQAIECEQRCIDRLGKVYKAMGYV